MHVAVSGRMVFLLLIAWAVMGCDATQSGASGQREPRLGPEYNTEYSGPSAGPNLGPSPGYSGPPKRNSAASGRQSRGYTYRQGGPSRSEQRSSPRPEWWSQNGRRSVREADYEAQEALRRAQFEVDRAFEIANEYARRWAGEELDLAQRNAQEGIRAAQDNTARAMQEAARRSGESGEQQGEAAAAPAEQAPAEQGPPEPSRVPFEESTDEAPPADASNSPPAEEPAPNPDGQRADGARG